MKYLFLLIALNLMIPSYASVITRLKDIARIKEVRDNQLTGYGIIVGLDGTGDKTQITANSIINRLKDFGIVADNKTFISNNIAAVMVTASLPAFTKEGDKIDILVSSIGDAKSLQGGVLLQTPLFGADQQVYAVGYGPLSIGGFNAGVGGGAGGQANHVTVGQIPGGAIVEKEVPYTFSSNDKITLVLNKKDFLTANRVSHAINAKYGNNRSKAIDAGTIDIKVPFSLKDNIVGFIAEIETIKVMPDNKATIIINEKTGTIVMGENVTVSEVAITHGNISIKVKDQAGYTGENSSDPEKKENVIHFNNGSNIGDVVRMLNYLGVKVKDLIAIIQTLKSAGAINADVKII